MKAMLSWLQQDGPLAPKHHGWAHPAVACVLHYVLATTITFAAHEGIVHYWSQHHQECVFDQLQQEDDLLEQQRRHTVANFLAVYAAWLLVWRLWITPTYRSAILYEYTWLCNVSLVMGCLALHTNRPLFATAHCIAVSIDQVLWYVDLLVATLTRFRWFPIGVSKYLTWPGTSWKTRLTCTHHIWTIPLLLWAFGRGLHWLSFPLSVVIVATHVCVSRWLTPPCVMDFPGSANVKYLNCNLSHELWKDISFSFLQINYDDPPVTRYLFRLLWRWQVLNFLTYCGLYIISVWLLGPAAPPSPC